jgi:hypothetical protein
LLRFDLECSNLVWICIWAPSTFSPNFVNMYLGTLYIFTKFQPGFQIWPWSLVAILENQLSPITLELMTGSSSNFYNFIISIRTHDIIKYPGFWFDLLFKLKFETKYEELPSSAVGCMPKNGNDYVSFTLFWRTLISLVHIRDAGVPYHFCHSVEDEDRHDMRDWRGSFESDENCQIMAWNAGKSRVRYPR